MKSIKWITSSRFNREALTLAALAALTIFLAPSYLASAQAQGPDADRAAQAQNRGERFGQRGPRAEGMSVIADLLGLSGEELRAEQRQQNQHNQVLKQIFQNILVLGSSYISLGLGNKKESFLDDGRLFVRARTLS